MNPFYIDLYVPSNEPVFDVNSSLIRIESAGDISPRCSMSRVDQFNEGTRIKRRRGGKKRMSVARVLSIFINRWQIDNTHAILHLDRFYGAGQTFLYHRLLINPSCLDRPDAKMLSRNGRERKRGRKWSLIVGCLAKKCLLVFISIGIPRKREEKGGGLWSNVQAISAFLRNSMTIRILIIANRSAVLSSWYYWNYETSLSNHLCMYIAYTLDFIRYS